MSTFSSFREKLHEGMLRKRLRKHQSNRQSFNLDKAVSIGILFDGTELAMREPVLKFAEKLKKQQKKVKLLAFMDNREDNSSFPFRTLNRKEIDFYLRPKKQEAKEFMQRPFDLLISLCLEPISPLNYIAAFSQARFRVGPYSPQTDSLDLLIDLPEGKKTIQELIRQAEIYLNKMDADHEKANA